MVQLWEVLLVDRRVLLVDRRVCRSLLKRYLESYWGNFDIVSDWVIWVKELRWKDSLAVAPDLSWHSGLAIPGNWQIINPRPPNRLLLLLHILWPRIPPEHRSDSFKIIQGLFAMRRHRGHIGVHYYLCRIEGQVDQIVDAFLERVHDVVDVVDVVWKQFDHLVVILCIQRQRNHWNYIKFKLFALFSFQSLYFTLLYFILYFSMNKKLSTHIQRRRVIYVTSSHYWIY